MRRNAGLLSLLMVAAVVFFAGPAWAADVQISVTGAPTTAYQGETKDFIITVSASGQLNINQHDIPGTVLTATEYTAGAGASVDASSQFTARTTPEEGCVIQPGGQNAGNCQNSQPVSGGPYGIGASLIVPADLVPGLYTVTIVASSTQGLTLPSSMPSFVVEVFAAVADIPSISILVPENGAVYKVNQPVTASVEIESEAALTDMWALLNDDDVTLILNTEYEIYEADIVLWQPGVNGFLVTACNSAGCADDSVEFTVSYDFGAWLPPITTAKFQRGRTLPVKFTINDFYGPTPDAVAMVSLNGEEMGQAELLYDDNGIPYYQLNIKLDVPAGSATVTISLDDGVTSPGRTIQVK